MSLFTPRKSRASGERYSMKLSPEDSAKTSRGEAWSAVVTDTQTGQQYNVRGIECSLPRCFCDAVAEPLVQPPTETLYTTSIWLGLGPEFESEEGEHIAEVIEDVIADLTHALILLRTPGVSVEVLYEKHGNALCFETTDEAVAKEHDFDEMLRPGAEDFEPTPWTEVRS
jgi:hypothetical protein